MQIDGRKLFYNLDPTGYITRITVAMRKIDLLKQRIANLPAAQSGYLEKQEKAFAN